MKWEEITDRSKVAVEEALSGLLGEEKASGTRQDPLVGNLQDADYLMTKLQARERYRSYDAFRQMKSRETRKKHLRYLVRISVAACLVIACGLLYFFRQETEVQPVVTTREPAEPRPAEMKAILVKTDGQEILLGKQNQKLQEKNGMWITADSNGLEYTRRQAVTSDTEASNTLIVPRGGMYLLTLSDSTRVWLNADSRLEYPLAFSGNMREVKLKGEAYFEVVKNAEAPFVVKTDLGDIKVLGTQFNVKCYPEEPVIATTLVSGKVSFTNPALSPATLRPGQQLTYKKGADRAVLRPVNVRNYVGWRENLLVFQSEPLENIMQVLSRWYDTQSIFENDRLKQLEFSGNLDKYTDIKTFFRLFEMGADVRFEIDDRTVYVRENRK